MTNQDIIFASIVGSKLFKTSQNLTLFQNNNQVLNAPTYNNFGNLNKADTPLSKDQQFFPLGFQFDENGLIWWFPFEPLISVNGKNIVTRQSVTKRQEAISNKNIVGLEDLPKGGADYFGTLKNMRPDDYEIKISGILFGENERGNAHDCYPRHDLQKLVKFMTSKTHIWVYSPVLELLGINKIAVEEFSLPFTKGENTQAYEIKAFSDSGKYQLEALNGTFNKFKH